MGIKTIPLSRLKADLRGTLSECANSGQAVAVELPDGRLIALQPYEPDEDDMLVDDLLETNPAFQALDASSKASPRKLLSAGADT